MTADHQKNSTNILVVDDTRTDLRLLVGMLVEKGYSVRPTLDGSAALVGARTEPPDLILLDVRMPDMDGYEVCQRLKADERTSDIPVIFISASDEVFDKVKAFSMGAVDYIAKPYQADEVLVRVETHLIMRNLQKQLQAQNRALQQEIVERQRIEQALQSAHNELEQRVAQRTAELANANASLTSEVAERQRAEATLRENQQLLQGIVDNTTAVLHIKDLTGRYVLVNRQFQALFGYDPTEIIAKTPHDLFPAEIAADLMAKDKAALQAGTTIQSEDSFTFDDEVRTYLAARFPLFDIGGEPYAIANISTDISDRKRAEQEREQLVAELEAKNAELERFTYTVSHDLKSPVVTISGFIGLLEKDAAEGDSERLKQDIEYIREAASRMKQLLDELLELSRIGRLVNPSQAVPLDELARAAVSLVAGQIAERAAQVDIAPDLPTVWGDRPRLLEVLQNLLDNAVKFMDDQPKPRVEIGALQVGEKILCYVRDNGMGIKHSYHKKIFDLFERLDQSVEGTGIGLALVKRIIEVHGGRIWVESEGLGSGSTFYFSLPNKTASADAE